ncbi:MAG TPA: glycerol-3-phosphate dehydrogenase/oxidase [Candidatus Krumholzibacteria bacterium]
MNRESMRTRLDATREPWDVLVIGGGATGLGCALDAAARGFRTVLVEARDFAAGTSSRSTKLFHGGVRYLRGGHVQLVAQSLREREHVRHHAAGLVRDMAFLVPAYGLAERFYFSAGLRLYDVLSRAGAADRSHAVSRDEALRLCPTLQPRGLRGGVIYHDLQFDDARFAMELARAAAAREAVLLNYAGVEELMIARGRVEGVVVRDAARGDTLSIRARVVINAAGVFADEIRRLARPQAAPMLRFSRGAHIVLDNSFLGGETAVLVPRTDDDRVVFVIPWRGHVLVGTTDTPVDTPDHDPSATADDVNFLIEHAARYLMHAPGRHDVKSAFAGLRPLPAEKGRTANVRRDHRVEVAGGMVTICGGKWTTYRLMAHDAVDAAAKEGALASRPDTRAESLGAPPAANARLEEQIVAGDALDADDVAEITRIARDEMALTVEDVLARRTRALFLDARRSVAAARVVAETMAGVSGRDAAWIEHEVESFAALADRYSV